MPISVRILSRSSVGISSAAPTAWPPPAIGGRPPEVAASSCLRRSKRPVDSLPPATSSGIVRRPSSSRPPNRKNTTTLSSVLKMNEEANSSVAFSASALRSTTPLTIEPKTLIGEKPPAVAPLMMNRPISTGLMPYWIAKPMPIGATIATAPGTTAPDAVSTAVTRNMTHGIAAMRPPTARTAPCTSQSTVPFAVAMPNRYVTPTRITNRSPGKPRKMSSSDTPSAVPSPKAATMPSTPMLIDSVVPTAKIATRMRIEINSFDMCSPCSWSQRRPDQLHGMPGLPPHPV